ncbi:MAG: FAD-dependent oxidoreductase [Chloroflexota bacterium]
MQTQAQIVIVGGGIVGCSIAYHLAQRGWRDIIVLDKGPLFENDGSSSHAPGILGLVTGSPTLTKWAVYSSDLYAQLGCFHRVGGLDIALSEATERELRRRHGLALARGLPARFVSPEERDAIFPHLTSSLRTALFHPYDGITHGPTICQAFAKRCGDAVTFRPDTPVVQLKTHQGQITGVVTAEGEQLMAEKVVLATNIWGALLAEQVGLTIPMLAAQHQYVVTDPLPLLSDETDEIRMPNARFFDYGIYVRQHHQAYGFGSYHHTSRMVQANDIDKTAIKPFTPDDFDPAWELMQAALPACEGQSFARAFNGMFGFTVDDQPILGETPTVRGLWVALGAWVTHAGGVGRTLAEWISSGTPDCDIHTAHINRFHAHQRTAHYILKRSATHYQQHLQVIHPREPWGEPRNMRQAPYHERLESLGAAFDEFAGWEMAQWYEANAPLVEKYKAQISTRDAWGGRHWSPICAAEHLATREAAGLFNINGLTRLEVTGEGAVTFLEKMCANRVDRPVGKVVYTTLLNDNGKIVADLIIVRLEETRFLLITSTLHGQHDLAWLQLHQPADVELTDVSDQWTGVAIWGPKAHEIVQPLTEADLGAEAFPYYTAQSIQLGEVSALALQLSFVGEPGWEFHVPTAQGLQLWDMIWEFGKPHGLAPVGSVALDSLSKEKGYLIYGHDINGDHTPYEAGLGWAVKMQDREFLGKAALQQQRPQTRRCTLTFDTPTGFALGGEPVLAEGQCIGYVTSANGGYSVGKHIAYAYLPLAYCSARTRLMVEYLGERYPVTVVANPLYK